MALLHQAFAVTALNLRSIPQRIGSSLVVVIGIAGVVAVLVAVLAMAEGYRRSLLASGRPDRAIVLRAGAASELTSLIPREAAAFILDAPGIRRDGDEPVASAEPVLSIGVTSARNGEPTDAAVRGVGAGFGRLRPELRLTEGRMFRPGTRELIVGRAAATEFRGVRIGERLRVRDDAWTIVGHFESGDAHESELVGDADAILSGFRRDGYQSVTLALASPAALGTVRTALAARPDLGVEVRTERAYLADRAAGLTRLLGFVARVVAGIMALGAVFGAIVTMHAAVDARAAEIATLRAIGFGAGAIILSVLAEAIALALAGSMLGAAAAWALFNGHAVSTRAGGFAQIMFPLSVSGGSLASGIAWALAIGLLGALLPAWSAARRPIIVGLRQA